MSNYGQQNLFAVDTSGVGEMGGGYEVYPTGQYPAIMTTVGMKATKDGQGAYLECVYQFVECELEGKNFTSRINLRNNNPKAVEIALKEIKALRVALGLSDTEADESKYINRPVILDIVARNRRDENKKPLAEMENQLNKILPYGQPQQQAPAPAAYQPAPAPATYHAQAAQAQPNSQAAPGSGVKPWQTKR